MEITTKNYKSKLSDELVKKSLRCEVRECDELNPGNYEAYVDELDKSFDVKLQLNKTTITLHSCDCSNTASFCQHKIALLTFISKGSKPAPKISSAKKVDPMEKVIVDTDPEKINAWLLKTLKKHKDLGIAFMNEFANRADEYSPVEIITIMQDIVKAVINKRNRAEAPEVKKITDLWTSSNRPIIDLYLSEPANPNQFTKLQAIMDTISYCRYQISTGSKRFLNYTTQIVDEVAGSLSRILDDETWETSLSHLSKAFYSEDSYGIRREYTNIFVKNFINATPQRKSKIVSMTAAAYEARIKEKPSDADELSSLLLDMVISNNQFRQYQKVIKPIRHKIEHNLRLIDALLEIGELDTAEQYCNEQIAKNTDSYYDREYLARLRNIYLHTKDEKKYVVLLTRTLLDKPNFTEYKLVAGLLEPNADFKKWRTQVLANARQLAVFDKTAADFPLALRHYEGDIQGLINYIDEKADYDTIAKYAADLLKQSPHPFMKKLVEKLDSHRDNELKEFKPKKIEVELEKLYKLCLEKFGAEALKIIVARQESKYRDWSNSFVKYVIKNI